MGMCAKKEKKGEKRRKETESGEMEKDVCCLLLCEPLLL